MHHKGGKMKSDMEEQSHPVRIPVAPFPKSPLHFNISVNLYFRTVQRSFLVWYNILAKPSASISYNERATHHIVLLYRHDIFCTVSHVLLLIFYAICVGNTTSTHPVIFLFRCSLFIRQRQPTHKSRLLLFWSLVWYIICNIRWCLPRIRRSIFVHHFW